MRAAEVRGRSGKQEPGITSRLAASLCYWLRVRSRAAGVRDEGDFFFESEMRISIPLPIPAMMPMTIAKPIRPLIRSKQAMIMRLVLALQITRDFGKTG